MLYVEKCIDFADSFIDLITDQAKWSQETFGSDDERGPTGALRHLAKEAAEAESAVGGDQAKLLEELADCFLLLLDAMRRSKFKLWDLLRASHAKMAVNKSRRWPKPVDAVTPVEHVRES